MKIAILGTRGIPNYYGGFEQFAEYLSEYLAKNGHEVFVYCSNDHPYKESSWNSVNLIHKPDPEDRIGTIGQFIYDFFCIWDSRSRDFDIILQLGYTSNSVWGWLLPSKTIVVTNMDGLEWKRTKYSAPVQKFLHFAESLAIRWSKHLIADSIGIQKYLYSRYKATSTYIPYGAIRFTNPQSSSLDKYNITPYGFNLVIARLEPENSVETILDGSAETVDVPLLVVGNYKTDYGNYLVAKFAKFTHIHFLGGIYDFNLLNNLRYFSNLYFHGHTVGGTNPSLLEAMAADAFICAHKNIFNISILGEDALYFEDYADIEMALKRSKKEPFAQRCLNNNQTKISEVYNWDMILKSYETFLKQVN